VKGAIFFKKIKKVALWDPSNGKEKISYSRESHGGKDAGKETKRGVKKRGKKKKRHALEETGSFEKGRSLEWKLESEKTLLFMVPLAQRPVLVTKVWGKRGGGLAK